MTGPNSLIFLDTNILVYAADASSKFQNRAKDIIEKAGRGEFIPAISPQILLEFYSLITNKKRFKNYYTQIEAVNFVKRFIAIENLKIIFLNSECVGQILEILSSKIVNDREIFDAEIVATMLVNGVKIIYTANKKNFVKLSSEIEVIDPFSERGSETKTLKATLTEAQQ